LASTFSRTMRARKRARYKLQPEQAVPLERARHGKPRSGLRGEAEAR
jgi:hypothetical protein